MSVLPGAGVVFARPHGYRASGLIENTGKTNMSKTGKLTRIPLREVWSHEERDFSRWLAKNLDYLEECTGLSLSLIETEAITGDFAVDILAEDSDGNLVVIENQLERTDHEHLGKLITYMANHEAKAAIWVTAQPRPEHERAIHWLNELLPADTAFYLVQVEAVQIDQSAPAPLFTVVAGPSPEGRQIGAQRKALAERHILRLEFWQQLLEKARGRSTLFANISPSKDSWISTGAGRTGLAWSYVVLKDHARVELYIDTRDSERNKAIFDFLAQHKETIERAFGAALAWQRLEEKRAARICYYIRGRGGLHTRKDWHDLQESMIDAMDRLRKAIQPQLENLP